LSHAATAVETAITAAATEIAADLEREEKWLGQQLQQLREMIANPVIIPAGPDPDIDLDNRDSIASTFVCEESTDTPRAPRGLSIQTVSRGKWRPQSAIWHTGGTQT